MELYTQMIMEIIANELAQKIIPGLEVNINEIISMKCYDALKKIKAVIEDDSLDDKECYMKIEAIVNVFEAIGSNDGWRHDY